MGEREGAGNLVVTYLEVLSALRLFLTLARRISDIGT
jgi:hypothetical protein